MSLTFDSTPSSGPTRRFTGGIALLAAALITFAAAPRAEAQRYILRGNVVLNADDVTIGVGQLVQKVRDASGGSFERSFPFSDIVRLDFPEPEAFEAAERLITGGKGAEALALVEPVYRQFAAFSRIPGNHWARAADLRLQSLLLGEDSDTIAAAAREIMQAQLGPDITGTAKLALARLDARANRESLAVIMIEEILREATPAVQARAWLLRGDLAARRAAHIEALEAYLRIPAFFGTFDELMPHALLGSARAYRGFGDNDRAERAAIELIDNYPDAREAALARTEFRL